MDAARWSEIKPLLDAALSHNAVDRAQFVEQACGNDADLRAEVLSLLAAEHDAFLQAPALVAVGQVAFDDTDDRRAMAFTDDAESRRATDAQIGTWSILRQIGQGGMGTVYEATRVDGDFAQRSALKLVRDAFDSDAARQRFRRERRLLARLQHRNIATLLDGGFTSDGRPWFAMELVEGEPITHWCDAQRLTLPERLSLLRQVCAAVQHAHRAMIVHRDLKPGNILVTRDGTVKLLDFGIATVLDDAADRRDTGEAITRPGTTPGTPAYMAPEVLRDEAATASADIYALGVICYEVVCGRLPFPMDGATRGDWKRAVLEQAPPLLTASLSTETAQVRRESSVRSLSKALSGDIARIVAMALHKDPERRYASAEQLGEDLRRCIASLPVLAQPDSFAYRWRTFVRRNRAGVLGAATAIGALIAGLIGTAWQARVAGRERDRAQVSANRAGRVSAFMEQTFRAADPRAQGKDITVASALETAERRASLELARDPRVYSALLHSIGRTYLGLGRYDDANRTMRQALAVLLRDGDTTSGDFAALVRSLAALEAERGAIAPAESLYRDALRRVRQKPIDPLVLGGVLDGFGSLQLDKGDFAAAEQTLRQALALRRQSASTQPLELAGTLNNLGVSIGQQNRWREAIPLHEAALRTLRADGATASPDIATGLNTLANAFAIVGDYLAADTLFRQALDMRVRLLGAHHPDVAWTHYSYGDMLRLAGHFERAIGEAKAVLAERGGTLPETHPMISSALTVYGRSQLSLGRPLDAEPALRESLRLRRAAYPAGHWLIASAVGAVGECLLAQGHAREAEPLLVQALTILRASKGDADQRTRDLAVALERARARR